MKHLWDKGQMWSLFATTAAYAMNTFTSEALSGLSLFQLIFLRDPPDLTSLSFPKIDTMAVKHREYYNLLLARAELVGNILLEWRTKQAYETALKNTLLNKFAIEIPNNKLQEVTLQDGSKELIYLPGTIMDYAT